MFSHDFADTSKESEPRSSASPARARPRPRAVVDFVAQEQEREARPQRRALAHKQAVPRADALEARLERDVVDEDADVRPAKKARRKRAVALLPSRVPDLEREERAVHFYLPAREIGADRRAVLRREFPVDELAEDRRLPDSRVPEENDFHLRNLRTRCELFVKIPCGLFRGGNVVLGKVSSRETAGSPTRVPSRLLSSRFAKLKRRIPDKRTQRTEGFEGPLFVTSSKSTFGTLNGVSKRPSPDIRIIPRSWMVAMTLKFCLARKHQAVVFVTPDKAFFLIDSHYLFTSLD
jgi:hypothetical protein